LNRWDQFTKDELALINQSLIDWYLRFRSTELGFRSGELQKEVDKHIIERSQDEPRS
jgi:hypothetical protein